MNIFLKIANFLNSPVIKLLQKENAVLIISFLYNEYSLKEKKEIQKFELIRLLDMFLMEVKKDAKDKYSFSAKEYIELWQKDEMPYLQTLYFSNELNDWMIEPTTTVKKVFQWIDELEDPAYIDTEIGFVNILNTMKKIVFGTLMG